MQTNLLLFKFKTTFSKSGRLVNDDANSFIFSIQLSVASNTNSFNSLFRQNPEIDYKLLLLRYNSNFQMFKSESNLKVKLSSLLILFSFASIFNVDNLFVQN